MLRNRRVWTVIGAALAISTFDLALYGDEYLVEAYRVAGDETTADGLDEGSQTALFDVQCQETDCEQGISGSISVPGSVTLDVDPAHRWAISARLPAHWTPETVLDEEGSVSLRFFPTAEINGEIDVPDAEPLPEFLRIRFESSPDPAGGREGAESSIPRSNTDCVVGTDAKWSCQLPRGTLDLRVQADALAPVYFWDLVHEGPGATHLGSLEFRNGASIVGWVASTERSEDENGLPRIEAVPQALGSSLGPAESRRLRGRAAETNANSRGFFQLTGLLPGIYDLSVQQEGYATGRISSVLVREEKETVLSQPIILHRPLTVELFLEPAVDPAGRDWIVEIRRERAFSRVFDQVTRAPADSTGHWAYRGLESDTYEVVVFDEDQSIWSKREFDAYPDMNALFIEIPVVPIEGTIEIGDEPLQTRLNFGAQTTPNIFMDSDDRGRFQGYLPREGLWPVDLIGGGLDREQAIEPVLVERSTGQRMARVEIVLPGTRLEGEVVQSGEAVPHAAITMVRNGEKLERGGIMHTDEEGKFEFVGIPPGGYSLQARGGSSSSDWINVEVREDLSNPSLRLELEEKVEIDGHVFSSTSAVPGARLIAVPITGEGSGPRFLVEATTGAGGGFTLSIDRDVPFLDLILAAPGYALDWLRLPIRSQGTEPLLLPVETVGGVLSLRWSDKYEISSLEVAHEGARLPVPTLLELYDTGFMSVKDGIFSFSPVSSGAYALCAKVDPGALECSQGLLSPHGELLLSLEQDVSSGDPEPGAID